MTRHLFIAGHGYQMNGSFDPGATGYITKGEYRYCVEDLFPAMKRHLPKGADVVFYDARKVSNWGNLAQIVKQYNADEVTEFHFDAHITGSNARGGHVIVYSGYAPDNVDLRLRNAIRNMVGVRYNHKGHAGISGRNNLWNVNDAKNRGITYRLLELGFGTNRTDANIMTGQVDQYAKELVHALFGATGSGTAKPAPAKKAPVKKSPAKKTTKKKSTGKKYTSVVDYMNDHKMNSSYSNRAKLAKQYGISNYRGTASQNTALLKALQNGKKVTSKKTVKKSAPKTTKKKYTSVVDFLKAQGRDSSFSARQRLAQKYGIRNYRGTASQNVQLLNKLQK